MNIVRNNLKKRRKLEPHEINMHTFKCQVCEIQLGSKEDLDIHLTTCKVYECYKCEYIHKRLSELKTHCKTKHTGNVAILHVKMNREVTYIAEINK